MDTLRDLYGLTVLQAAQYLSPPLLTGRPCMVPGFTRKKSTGTESPMSTGRIPLDAMPLHELKALEIGMRNYLLRRGNRATRRQWERYRTLYRWVRRREQEAFRRRASLKGRRPEGFGRRPDAGQS